MLKILFSYALRNLLRVRLRTFFTLFVISLVFSLFILLSSIGKELSQQIANTLDEQQIDVVIQSKFSTTPFSFSISEKMVKEVDASLTDGTHVVTQVVPLDAFYPAESYHQKYFENNKSAPYCQLIIEPKIEKIRKRFAELLKG